MRAYRELVGRHLNRSVKIAERVLGNRQDAEDVVQETCLKIWREAPHWKPRAKFSTWLYRVLLNACLDRKRKVVPIMTDDLEGIIDHHPIAEDLMMGRQRSEGVRVALEQLPVRQRAAIVLNYYEEMSNQEAADSMGIGLGAFQQLLFRAKQNVRTFLVGEDENDVARTGS